MESETARNGQICHRIMPSNVCVHCQVVTVKKAEYKTSSLSDRFARVDLPYSSNQGLKDNTSTTIVHWNNNRVLSLREKVQSPPSFTIRCFTDRNEDNSANESDCTSCSCSRSYSDNKLQKYSYRLDSPYYHFKVLCFQFQCKLNFKPAMHSRLLLLFCVLFSALLASNASYTGRTSASHPEIWNGPSRRLFPRYMPQHESQDQCETITVPMCRDIGYNKTDMSLSIMNKFSQSEAKDELELFQPLVKFECSSELKLLLCSLYTPVCMKGYRRFLPPCRFICERARNGCLPIMKRYGYRWPPILRCENFPTGSGKSGLCMHFNLTKPTSTSRKNDGRAHINHRKKHVATSKPSSTTIHPTSNPTTLPDPKTSSKIADKPHFSTKKNIPDTKSEDTTNPSHESGISAPALNVSNPCICRGPLLLITKQMDPLYNKVTTGGVPNCIMSCYSPYFTKEQQSTAENWLKTWSLICFVVTLITVSTFLIDMERFKYPERPIIFLSTCYMFVSVGFLIRIVAGHETVACASKSDHVLYSTTGPVICTAVFLLVYFFSMSSALWWVILSFTWFLAAGLKWGSEAIAKYSQYYHIAAWLIPSLKTIMVLATSSVDGDPLSGICLVGNQDVQALRGFVLAPLVVYLALGGIFLLSGFISLFRIRNTIKKDGSETDKLDQLIGRIGVFSVLYMVPAAVLVACYFYEQQYRTFWEYSYNCRPHVTRENSLQSNNIDGDSKTPEFVVFMVRYLMTLLIGITNGVWICSNKTIVSWTGFYRRCICCVCGAKCSSSCKRDNNTCKNSTCIDFCNPKEKGSFLKGSAKEIYSSEVQQPQNRKKREQDSSHFDHGTSTQSQETGKHTVSPNVSCRSCEHCKSHSHSPRSNKVDYYYEDDLNDDNAFYDVPCVEQEQMVPTLYYRTSSKDSIGKTRTMHVPEHQLGIDGKPSHNNSTSTRSNSRIRSGGSDSCCTISSHQLSEKGGSFSQNTSSPLTEERHLFQEGIPVNGTRSSSRQGGIFVFPSPECNGCVGVTPAFESKNESPVYITSKVRRKSGEKDSHTNFNSKHSVPNHTYVSRDKISFYPSCGRRTAEVHTTDTTHDT